MLGITNYMDIVVATYTILTVLFVVAYKIRSKGSASAEGDKVYRLPKKISSADPNAWKRKIAGKWTLVSRNNFKEFLSADGHNSFKVAVAAQVGNVLQIIPEKPDDITGRFEFIQTGAPAGVLPPQVVNVLTSATTPEERAKWVRAKGVLEGRDIFNMFWWDEENKTLVAEIDDPTFPTGARILRITRSLVDDNTLECVCERTKKANGDSVKYSQIMRREA